MSIWMAVKPVTLVSTPYFSSHVSPLSRRASTRSAVAGSSGPVVGTIWIMPVSTLRFGVAIGTWSTPGSASMSALRESSRPMGSVLEMMSTVTMSGPLTPGPKCSSIAS